MDEQAREELIEELIVRLRTEGAPEGTWLIDLTAARQVARDAFELVDDLLARLEAALIEGFRNL